MRMLRWICGHTIRDRVRNDDIRERLGVASVEDKLVQHCLRWFEHMQRRPAEAPIRNRVIRWTGNKKRGRRRPNLTWDEHVKKVLNDWCITKELALDRREQKLAIHVSEFWSSVPSFYCLLSSFFFMSIFHFFDLEFYYLFVFFIWFFYRHLFFLSFSLLFYTCFFFLCGVNSSLP
jgi:hypothetical protein